MLIRTFREGLGIEDWVTDRKLQCNDIVSLPGGIKARVTTVRHPDDLKFTCVELSDSKFPGRFRSVRKNRTDYYIIKEIK